VKSRYVASVFVLCAIFGTVPDAYAQAKKGNVRRGLFHTSKSDGVGLRAADDPARSIFTLGTVFGVAISNDDPSTFKVVNNIVVYDDERTKARPATYALPSINLMGRPGKSFSLIVPVNLSATVDLGLGASFGFNVFPRGQDQKPTAEVGFAAVAVWSNTVRLTPQQQQSFTGATALPAGASTEFRTAKRPGWAFGIYLVPLL
jgi:hypothetical protein